MKRGPVVMVLGEARWKWIYDGVMVALPATTDPRFRQADQNRARLQSLRPRP